MVAGLCQVLDVGLLDVGLLNVGLLDVGLLDVGLLDVYWVLGLHQHIGIMTHLHRVSIVEYKERMSQ